MGGYRAEERKSDRIAYQSAEPSPPCDSIRTASFLFQSYQQHLPLRLNRYFFNNTDAGNYGMSCRNYQLNYHPSKIVGLAQLESRRLKSSNRTHLVLTQFIEIKIYPLVKYRTTLNHVLIMVFFLT